MPKRLLLFTVADDQLMKCILSVTPDCYTLSVLMEATSVALVFHRTAWKAVCSSHGCIHYIKNRSCTVGSQYSQ